MNLAALREHANRYLAAAGQEALITRADPNGATYNPTTRLLTPAPSVTIYEGPCMVRANLPAESRNLGRLVSTHALVMRIPAGSNVQESDDVEMTTAPDADLVGQTWRVVGVELSGLRATMQLHLGEVGRPHTAR